ncbi:MAG: ABC transporter permease [Caldilineaceae bacterium]
MARYIIRRLLQAIPTLLGVSIIGFILTHYAPGDPVTFMTFDPNFKEADRVEMVRQLGLDQSLPLQYLSWFAGISLRNGDHVAEFTNATTDCSYWRVVNLTFCDRGGGVLRGQLGTSIQTKEAVWERMVDRMPATLELSIAGLVLALVAGIPLGVLSAVYRGSVFDNIVRFITVIGQAVPNFWLGIILIYVFAVLLGILPTGGRFTVTLTGETTLMDRLWHLILPALVLASGQISVFTRLMRTEVLEVLHTDYIRTAQAKGLGKQHIWFTHAFRNALIPLMTVMGPTIFGLLGGAVIIEGIFAWPGMGRLTLNAVFQLDYPMVLGSMMFFAALVILGNLFSDILYGVVDPRVRLS